MDLMGRKMRIKGGAPFSAYKKEIVIVQPFF
jgi:hypothetical protein